MKNFVLRKENIDSLTVFRIRKFWASRIRIHYSEVRIRIWIWIRILPSSSKNSKETLDLYCFETSLWLFICEEWCNVPLKSKKLKKTSGSGSVPKNVTVPEHCFKYKKSFRKLNINISLTQNFRANWIVSISFSGIICALDYRILPCKIETLYTWRHGQSRRNTAPGPAQRYCHAGRL